MSVLSGAIMVSGQVSENQYLQVLACGVFAELICDGVIAELNP